LNLKDNDVNRLKQIEKKFDWNRSISLEELVTFAYDLDNNLKNDDYGLKNLVKKKERDEWRKKHYEFKFEDIDAAELKVYMIDNDV